MIPVTNHQTNTIEKCISEYIDNPSSLDQRNHNIKIVYDIIEKLKSIACHTTGRDNLNFGVLKPGSQALKNNILEEISVHIMTKEDKNPCPVYITPSKYIRSLMAIGAHVTDQVNHNLNAFCLHEYKEAKTDKINGTWRIEIANEVSFFLKPGTNSDKKIDKLQQQITELQTQANRINKKITQIENRQKQCCRCTIL
jgi:hypothetical protein